jgi:hypothetical protein
MGSSLSNYTGNDDFNEKIKYIKNTELFKKLSDKNKKSVLSKVFTYLKETNDN